MAPSYNIASGHEAWYTTKQDGNTTVSIRSTSPMNFRKAYVGTASLEFYWVSSGKSTHWQFTPTLLDPTPAQTSETKGEDGASQIIDVELGNRMFPATGLIKPNITGEIRVPAVHFDVPNAFDIWVFILRSPWFPIKVNTEKTTLKIAHGSAQAMAQIENSNAILNDGTTLRADISVYGEGFKRIWLTMQRTVQRASDGETIGEVTSDMQTFSWKPSTRNFDVVLVAPSNMYLNSFLDFLKYLGAEINKSFFAFGSYMPNKFLLCDGPAMNYTLKLSGEKHFLGHENDETKITLTP